MAGDHRRLSMSGHQISARRQESVDGRGSMAHSPSTAGTYNKGKKVGLNDRYDTKKALEAVTNPYQAHS